MFSQKTPTRLCQDQANSSVSSWDLGTESPRFNSPFRLFRLTSTPGVHQLWVSLELVTTLDRLHSTSLCLSVGLIVSRNH